MRRVFLTLLVGLILSAGTAHVAQGPQTPGKFHRQRGERIPGEYIVALRDEPTPAEMSTLADQLIKQHRGQRRHVYTHALKGFSATMLESDAQRLSADPRVAYVEEDGVSYATSVQSPVSNWGLDRINQRRLPQDNAYTYFADGTGVTVYVVDSGVRVTHSGFGGRASGAYSAVDDGIAANEDCNGHGTHVAGIVGSAPWGVAKNVAIKSVRVLGCDNQGTWSDYIEGLDWIAANGVKPAVINASIGGPYDIAAGEAIDRTINAGFVFVGAAGNWNDDACLYIPGAVAQGIVVGSVDPADVRASTSNWGTCVDLFAPGDGIPSASAATDTAWETKFGTSMASPHVAGAAALYLQRFPTASPLVVAAEIWRGSTKNVLLDIPAGTSNALLFSPYLGDTVRPTVTLTNPMNGSTASGVIGLAATASDNAELQRVRFFRGNTLIGEDVTAPYGLTWDSRSVADGTYTVRADALDLAGNTGSSSASIAIRNGIDRTPPMVNIVEPVSGDSVRGTVTIRADATDDIAIARVEFIIDGITIGTDASVPYSATWDTTAVPEGAHTVLARAFDRSGNNKLSDPVVVEVDDRTGATLPAEWTSTDVGTVGQSGSADYTSGTFTLQAGGADVWSTADAFRYAFRSWTGDGDVVALVSGLTAPAGASFAMAGVMFRESLAANARHATTLIASNGKLKFRRRITIGGTTLSDGPPEGSVSVPHWLKVSRRGNAFTAYRSTDGRTWSQVGPTATIVLPVTLHVGVFSLRHGGAALARATLTHVTVNATTGPLPTGWTAADVGVVGLPGNAGYENGNFAVQAGGNDIWSTADAFHYSSRSWAGDGDIVARVASLPLPAGASFAMSGIMFRESLAANARHATVLIGTNGKLKYRRRTTTGGATLSDGPSEGSEAVPKWLKLSRRGNVFTAYHSESGQTWIQVGPSVTLTVPATVRVGIWTLRNGGTALAQSTFTNVNVSSAVLGTANDGRPVAR